ncbi:hypothetical protein MUP05_03705 [Candidatus Bathyarchaeota archaeon]|nr:hypothetical protein [Candidatus Bathyarchaeota archaeon]
MKEKQKALAKIKQQRAESLKKISEERKRLRTRVREFEKQKPHLIKQAVQKKTSRLESKIRALRRREKDVEKRAREKIREATERAHREAERLATAQLHSFKKDIRASVRDQIKKEKERATERAQRNYTTLKQRLRSAAGRLQIKDSQLRGVREELKELKGQLKKETTSQIEGLLYEKKLANALRKRFREDKVECQVKGTDVLQYVIQNSEQAGVLVYECKRVKHYLASHVKQAARAKEKMKADFAILVTNAMKKTTQGFFTERGVLVVHSAGVLYLTSVLREQIIRIAEMKLGPSQRNEAVKLTLEYLQGPEFSNSLDAIMQEAIATYNELKDEVRKHVASWKKRLASYRKIHDEALKVKSTTKALLSGQPEYRKLIRTETLPALPELPQLEKSVAPPEQTQNADPGEHRPNNTKKQLNIDSRTAE